MKCFTALATVALVALFGCGPINPPDPPDPPDPPTPPWECPLAEEMPGCHETGQTCSAIGAPCWHNPTSNPEHCEQAAPCPTDPPDPPDPPPSDGCAVESQLVLSTCAGAVYNATVKQATDALGDLTGGHPQENLKLLASKVKEQSGRECVFGGQEALFLLRPDGLYEENHAVFFRDGSWTGNGFGKFKHCHSVEGSVPPPSESCGPPHPNLAKMKFNHTDKGNHVDTTWTTVNQCAYCAEINMGCMPGTGVYPDCTHRCGCPVRPEGHVERQPCEAELCDQKWTCNGVPVEGWKGNPAQTNCQGHWVTWCSAEGSTARAEGDR